MSQENVKLVRRTKEDFNRGDYAAALTGFAADVEWVHALDPLSGPQTYRGHAELLGFWQKVAALWEGFRSEAQEYIDAGDRVVVPTRVCGRGRTSGAEVTTSEVELLTIRDGLIARRESFAELGDALAAAGLEAGAGG
jgi:ketosteroid isomerase-like protein